MRKRTKKLLAVALSAVLCISTAVGTARTAGAASYDDTMDVTINVTYEQSEARSMLELINDMRTGEDAWQYDEEGNKVSLEGLSELEYDYDLEAIAMQRAAELVLCYSHTRPDESSCFTVYDDISYSILAAGENIAAGYASVEDVFAGWSEEDEDYNGQGHRRNMLSSDYNRIGIACVEYNGILYWVQEFAYSYADIEESAAADGDYLVTVEISYDLISDWEVDFSPESYSLVVGDTAELPTIAYASVCTVNSWPSDMEIEVIIPDLTWASEDESKLVVNSDGTFTAVGAGVTTLYTPMFGSLLFFYTTVYDVEFVWDGVSCTAVFTNPDYDPLDPSSIASVEVPCEMEIGGWDPTCEEDGYLYYTAYCEFEGRYYEDQLVVVSEAYGHDWDNPVWEWSEDYTSATITFTCNNNGSEAMTLDAMITENIITEATCETDGSTEYVATARLDGVTYEDAVTVTIPATGHNYDEGWVSIEPTCTEDGRMIYTCVNCGDILAEAIPALGHDCDVTEYQSPTCTEDGYTVGTCSRCGEVVTTVIPATGHSHDEGVVIAEPTCTESGSILYTCPVCGETFYEETDPLGHSYEVTESKDAACAEDGYIVYTCSVCGNSYTETLPATGHDYSTTVKEPTCTEDGEIIYVCEICGDTYTEVIPATGHTFVHIEATEPTEEFDGNIEFWYCFDCGVCYADEDLSIEITFADTVIPATGSSDDDADTGDGNDSESNTGSDVATGSDSDSEDLTDTDNTVGNTDEDTDADATATDADTGNTSGSNSNGGATLKTGDVPAYLWIIILFAAMAGIYALAVLKQKKYEEN